MTSLPPIKTLPAIPTFAARSPASPTRTAPSCSFTSTSTCPWRRSESWSRRVRQQSGVVCTGRSSACVRGLMSRRPSMADRAFGNEIRRLVDEQVPEAPWLEDRVMAAVSKDAAGRSARAFDGRGARLVIAALAAAIIAVLAVAVLVGTRHAQHSNYAPGSKPSPSRDAAVLGYQALINRDLRLIYLNFGFICVSRQQCIALATQIRAATEVLLHDVESTPAPASLVPA